MNGKVEPTGDEEFVSQDEHEAAVHSIRWPDLEEEPEIDPEMEKEVDGLVWEAMKDIDERRTNPARTEEGE